GGRSYSVTFGYQVQPAAPQTNRTMLIANSHTRVWVEKYSTTCLESLWSVTGRPHARCTNDGRGVGSLALVLRGRCVRLQRMVDGPGRPCWTTIPWVRELLRRKLHP
ncbi:unnamed protein product, partial [Ectocarpus sp. 12 AP-2014]